ncbi:hypothetical protein [Thalassobacillus sp. C254]|uniref:hypothetical protein n=1 Tax=Thalassobacillus sp. C254 TaxID=1225341 RepID=UPI0006D0A6F4|nr:hypothetical protein [Thalassobacillus sp. C254]
MDLLIFAAILGGFLLVAFNIKKVGERLIQTLEQKQNGIDEEQVERRLQEVKRKMKEDIRKEMDQRKQ